MPPSHIHKHARRNFQWLCIWVSILFLSHLQQRLPHLNNSRPLSSLLPSIIIPDTFTGSQVKIFDKLFMRLSRINERQTKDKVLTLVLHLFRVWKTTRKLLHLLFFLLPSFVSYQIPSPPTSLLRKILKDLFITVIFMLLLLKTDTHTQTITEWYETQWETFFITAICILLKKKRYTEKYR